MEIHCIKEGCAGLEEINFGRFGYYRGHVKFESSENWLKPRARQRAASTPTLFPVQAYLTTCATALHAAERHFL
eukprot:23542-Amphidinium_carterae.1